MSYEHWKLTLHIVIGLISFFGLIFALAEASNHYSK